MGRIGTYIADADKDATDAEKARVQARLGVIVGPSPEMAAYVRDFGLGDVAERAQGQAVDQR